MSDTYLSALDAIVANATAEIQLEARRHCIKHAAAYWTNETDAVMHGYHCDNLEETMPRYDARLGTITLPEVGDVHVYAVESPDTGRPMLAAHRADTLEPYARLTADIAAELAHDEAAVPRSTDWCSALVDAGLVEPLRTIAHDGVEYEVVRPRVAGRGGDPARDDLRELDAKGADTKHLDWAPVDRVSFMTDQIGRIERDELDRIARRAAPAPRVITVTADEVDALATAGLDPSALWQDPDGDQWRPVAQLHHRIELEEDTDDPEPRRTHIRLDNWPPDGWQRVDAPPSALECARAELRRGRANLAHRYDLRFADDDGLFAELTDLLEDLRILRELATVVSFLEAYDPEA